MKKDVKDRWVAALRSGGYEQTTGKLHVVEDEKESFCCLGVLCDILKDEVPMDITIRDAGTRSLVVYGGGDAYPPEAIQKYVRPDAVESFKVKYNDRWVDLFYLNDSVGMSFNEIADIIEEQVVEE